MRRSNYYYCAATNDEFELTLFSGDTYAELERWVRAMADCKWMLWEICTNAECPMCCDYCPVADTEGVCRFEDRRVSDG